MIALRYLTTLELISNWPLAYQSVTHSILNQIQYRPRISDTTKLQGVNSAITWGRVTHICVGNLTIIGSDNGLWPGRRQAIIWTSAGTLLIGPLGANFCESLIEILTFSFKKMRLKVSSQKWGPFCPNLNVLSYLYLRQYGQLPLWLLHNGHSRAACQGVLYSAKSYL